jgi:hypothetical protein
VAVSDRATVRLTKAGGPDSVLNAFYFANKQMRGETVAQVCGLAPTFFAAAKSALAVKNYDGAFALLRSVLPVHPYDLEVTQVPYMYVI